MKTSYVVLRHCATARHLFGPRALTTTEAAPYGIRAELHTLEPRELAAFARDTSMLTIAPTMPMKLVAPMPRTGVVAEQQALTWGLQAVGADSTPRTGAGVVVAVLDSGIDAGHEAFAGISLVQKDFTGEGDGDRNGHGTHTAGTIFGRDVDGTRIGVAPGVQKALIGKVLDEAGGGSSDQIVNAMLWAVDQGAHVISMSLGMDFPGYVQRLVSAGMPVDLATARALEGYRANTRLFDTLAEHIRARAAMAQATVIVAAAGNESRRQMGEDFEVGVSPPAIAEGVISVAALQSKGGNYTAATFSNTGASISAPGVEVTSAASGGGLVSWSGTSMAAPHVAGVAALWAEQLLSRGRLDAFTLIGKLAGTASTEKLAPGFDPFDVGAGLVQCPQD